jgi:hypothetical protein
MLRKRPAATVSRARPLVRTIAMLALAVAVSARSVADGRSAAASERMANWVSRKRIARLRLPRAIPARAARARMDRRPEHRHRVSLCRGQDREGARVDDTAVAAGACGPGYRVSALANRICPLCNGANDCAPARTGNLATPCWCAAVAIRVAVMAGVPQRARNRSCVCSTCAGARRATLPKAVGDLT